MSKQRRGRKEQRAPAHIIRLPHLLADGDHGVAKAIQLGLALRLGGLDHERAWVARRGEGGGEGGRWVGTRAARPAAAQPSSSRQSTRPNKQTPRPRPRARTRHGPGHGGRVEAVINQPLSNVLGLHAGRVGDGPEGQGGWVGGRVSGVGGWEG